MEVDDVMHATNLDKPHFHNCYNGFPHTPTPFSFPNR